MSCYWKPENRHKYKELDMTPKPGEWSRGWQMAGLTTISILAAPVMFAALLALWYVAVPAFLGYMAILAYKHLSQR